jgi:methionine-rich copper-binding protein CopC
MSFKFALPIALALTLCAGAAIAHPHVVSSTPAKDAQVSGSPKSVRIKFNEAPSPAFSAIALKDASGKTVKVGKAGVDKADKTTLTAEVAQTLTPGVYTVDWQASGSDAHKAKGAYSFTVK